MLKDDSNTLKNKASIAQTDQQQYNKDRTLFCINIDQKCTEDILYELFLQAGPIDNIVRKQDRNGNLICLITYKHIESCEYAIKMFNGISLFNQSLKVRPSDANSALNSSINTNSRLNQSNVNIYQRAYSNNVNRQNSNEKLISQPTTPQSLMPPPQQLAANLSLISQALNNFSPQFPEFAMNNPFQHQQLNRSWSSSNVMNENDSQYHQSRRASNNNFDGSFNRGNSNNRRNDYNNSSRNSGGYNDFNNSRDFSKQSRSRDPRMNNYSNNEFEERQRSRSPIERNRKRNRR